MIFLAFDVLVDNELPTDDKQPWKFLKYFKLDQHFLEIVEA